jgi:hypothetical protein
MNDTEKACRLRALYRDLRPAVTWCQGKQILDAIQQDARWRTVKLEFLRLYPDEGQDLLAHIISSAWVEEKELAGLRYDSGRQQWLNRDGSRAEV